MRQAAILALAEQGYHARAPSPGILQIAVEPRLLAGIDDTGVVRVVRQLRIEALDDAPVGFDKALDAVPGHQYIVGGNTGLAGIHGLAEGDALGGIFQGDVPGNDGRRLAAQLQGDGCQVVRRRMQDVPADAGGAGEQQMIEGQAGKGRAHIRLAQHDRHLILREDPGQQVPDQLRRLRCGLAHLDHHPVARSQGADQRANGEKERVVPGHYHPDHSQRLIYHLRRAGLERQPQRAARWLHPAGQVPGNVVDGLQAGQQFGEQGLVNGAVAEVPAYR